MKQHKAVVNSVRELNNYVRAMELTGLQSGSVWPPFDKKNEMLEHLRKQKIVAQGMGDSIQIHLPYDDWNPFNRPTSDQVFVDN